MQLNFLFDQLKKFKKKEVKIYLNINILENFQKLKNWELFKTTCIFIENLFLTLN